MNKPTILLAAAAVTTLNSPAASAQRDTVRAVASSWIAQPVAGVDTASVYFNRGGNRQLGITYIETTTKTPAGFLIVQQNLRPNGVAASLDSIEVAAGTLAPLWHADVTPRGRMRVEFANGRMTGTSTDTAGVATRVDAAVAPGALDFSTGGEFVRLLPLKVGYDAVLLTNDVHRGAIHVGVRVVGEEEIEVGGRRMKAWSVEKTNAGRTTRHWIDQASRREVKVLVDMGNGNTMEMERRPH